MFSRLFHPKDEVASSILVRGYVVARTHGKGKVASSILVRGYVIFLGYEA